jgi:CheY-like chemotaxis protein
VAQLTKGKRTALVVDDEDDARAIVVELLKEMGWETLEAENGDDALTKATMHNPDVVFFDVIMPGKTGFEAFKELREDHRTSHIPVVILSAINDYELGMNYETENIGQRLGVLNPEGFLPKPYSRDALAMLIRTLFDK